MRVLVAMTAGLAALLFAAPAQGAPTYFPGQGVTVSWTTPKIGNAGSVALRCVTDEPTPRFWATHQPLPLNGSWEIGKSSQTVVFNYGAAYFDWTGTVTCEGRVISKSGGLNGTRIVGNTTPRFFPNLGPVTPGLMPVEGP
jgi:hypothetical protein